MKKLTWIILLLLFSISATFLSCNKEEKSPEENMETLRRDPNFIANIKAMHTSSVKIATNYYGENIFKNIAANKTVFEQFKQTDVFRSIKSKKQLDSEMIKIYKSLGMLHAEEYVELDNEIQRTQEAVFANNEFLRKMSQPEALLFMKKVSTKFPEFKFDATPILDTKIAVGKN